MLAEVGTGFWDGFDIYWPAIWLFLGATGAVSLDLLAKNKDTVKGAVLGAALLGVLLALIWIIKDWPDETSIQHRGGIVIDQFGSFLSVVVLCGTVICCLTAHNVMKMMRISAGDFLALALVSASGMLLLTISNDLIMLFLSIELMSLAIYVLAGINRKDAKSSESAMKYLVMGSFASGFLLLGMALIYGVTQEVRLDLIAGKLATMPEGYGTLALLGGGLMLIGFAFKVGAVPFHQWVPDVYTGAPMPVTAFMAVAVKAAAFAAFARVVVMMVPDSGEMHDGAMKMLWFLSAITIVIGNWMAVTQESVKRLLAYSSVAHSGYLMMGLVAVQDLQAAGEGLGAIAFYLAVYVFATGGAFVLLTYISGERDSDNIRDLKGLAWRRPGSAMAMGVFMLSLAGIPLTGGFVGKFSLFKASVDAGMITLTVLAVVGSLIGAYYYLRVIVYLYMKEPEDYAPEGVEGWGVSLVVGLSAVFTVVLGVSPQNFQTIANNAGIELSHQGRSLRNEATFDGLSADEAFQRFLEEQERRLSESE